jgi:acyl-coenzyme A synthetase/AMP-(fatty) acid ligase
MAFVLLQPAAIKKWNGHHDEFEQELKNHTKGRLPGFARPEWVRVVDELPKTSTGKPHKPWSCGFVLSYKS